MLNQEEPEELKQPEYDGLNIGIVSFLETITVWILALFFLLPFLAWFYIAGNA
mgnify:CR=1 FL=1